MGQILRIVMFLLIAEVAMLNFRVLARRMSAVAKSFETNNIVPDVLPKAPQQSITVSNFHYFLTSHIYIFFFYLYVTLPGYPAEGKFTCILMNILSLL